MSKTLLLADDSVVIQKLVVLSFANEDLEIFSTDNGDDAVTKARELRPDVVLADVVMPGKSGYEVCEAIKKDASLAHIPVLLLTGTFEAFDEARAQAVGAAGHITKPFEAQALVERVKAVIKNAVKPAPTREPAPRATSTADDLFDEGDRIPPPAARSSFFGTVESLDMDLFGPPGDVGGATPSGAFEALGSGRFADAPIEDATVAMIAEPFEPRAFASDRTDAFGDDDLLEISPLPAASFDLDSAFDPAPPPLASSFSSSLKFARHDANAATSRSLGRPGAVADLDEILATPVPSSTAHPIARIELRPKAPTILDLGPAEQSDSDLDFGFDVSEQLAVSKVDLLEESFSSLLDLSGPPMLDDARFAASSAGAYADLATPPATHTPSLQPTPGRLSSVADFDVSSSELATAAPILTPFSPSPALSPPARSTEVNPWLAQIPPPLPASATSSSAAAVAHMSPILQQQVHETLEKVAWEAFSDLSEAIVKQVIERVERIAWEVIPQMAETLVREEIRKLKGEDD